MDNSWRASLAHDSRQKIVKRIMETLQRHMPVAGQDGVDELLKIAGRFEEKIFQSATDQQDYLRKISLKMLSLETKANGNPLESRHPPGAEAVPQPGMEQVDAAAMAIRNSAQTLGNGVLSGSQAQQQLQQQQQQQLHQQQLQQQQQLQLQQQQLQQRQQQLQLQQQQLQQRQQQQQLQQLQQQPQLQQRQQQQQLQQRQQQQLLTQSLQGLFINST